MQVRQADKRTGAVVCNSQLYSNLAHLEPPPAPSHDDGLSVDGQLPRVSPASAPQVGSASRRATTLNSTPSDVALSYDAAADELNEQCSTSLPASDLDDFSWSGSSGFEEIQAEWLQVRCQRTYSGLRASMLLQLLLLAVVLWQVPEFKPQTASCCKGWEVIAGLYHFGCRPLKSCSSAGYG